MFRTPFHFARKAVLTAFVATGFIATVAAQDSTPATGLGQAWPNTPDYSASPYWHVYVFKRDGIKYVQVNDIQGTVRAAVGTTGGIAFALPIGSDVEHVTVESSSAPVDLTQTIYQDDEITVMTEPQVNGGVLFTIQAACGDPLICTGQRVAAQ